MPNPSRTPFRALIGATVLAVAGLAVPAGTAAADPGCAPVIDPGSVTYTPSVLVVPAKGHATQRVGATATATCAKKDGSDLQVEVVLSAKDDLDGTLGLTDDEAASPSGGPHGYRLRTEYDVRSRDLRNADAGTWTTELFVTDTDDDPAHSYDEVDGPSISILRAARATAKATPATVKLGKKVTVKGKLVRASWNSGKDGAYGKQPVQLQFRAKGTSPWTTLTTVTSSSKGKLSAKVVSTTDGSYRFAFAGSATTAAATSPADAVHVK